MVFRKTAGVTGKNRSGFRAASFLYYCRISVPSRVFFQPDDANEILPVHRLFFMETYVNDAAGRFIYRGFKFNHHNSLPVVAIFLTWKGSMV
jgi:hypothetical protein